MTLSKAGDLRDRGFTLIELLVVCSILAALAFTAWSGLVGVQEGMEDDIAHAQMQRLAEALKRFKVDTGYYPGERSGPFVLASPGTTEGSDQNCSGGSQLGVLRSWAKPATLPENNFDKDLWFMSPANLAMLYEAPPLCANHPQHYLNRWNSQTRRGWHGPYLDLSTRLWVDHGADFNADSTGSTGPGAGAPDGDSNVLAGQKILDIPAFGAGPAYPAAGPGWGRCDDQSTGIACMLGWRNVLRSNPGYDAAQHELGVHPRPFAVFGLADNTPTNPARIVYFGRDSRYGGLNTSDPCQPNAIDSDGKDDTVLCLGR